MYKDITLIFYLFFNRNQNYQSIIINSDFLVWLTEETDKTQKNPVVGLGNDCVLALNAWF